ncbi:hypothetical protein HYY75_12750 [bacterium]|nr:hypothetical protein [bacterium]
MKSQETNQVNDENAVQPIPNDPHLILCWCSILSTVFLASATLTTLLRFLSNGERWDAGGMIFSGILAWLCYARTLSENAFPEIKSRIFATIGLPIVWLVGFPILLRVLGFK